MNNPPEEKIKIARFSLEPNETLTPRELEVLIHIADGLTSPKIAHQFGRGLDSVEAHRKSIIRKLVAKNTPHAVAIAFRNKLIQ